MFIRPTRRQRRDEGASAVEYGLLVAAIAAIIILLVFAVGRFAKQSFKDTCDNFASQSDAPVNSQATCN
jgi:pilus assembly protein Flp/PilA